jgi:cell division transport system ATP-binding protein
MSILEFINVKKNFGSIVALEDITFSIDEGEFVFITGPSGVGKTTILKLIIREIAPSEGEIIFNEKKIHSLKKKEIPEHRQSIGAVFQDFKLLPGRTIRENTEVALAVKGVPRQEWEARVDQVLGLVGLSARSELFPSQLSGGELQRAALARALVVNPKLIFADEPTGNLDWKTADGIMDLLEKINAEGKTVLVTTHNHAIVQKMGKRVIELEDGKVVKDTKGRSKKHEK